VCSDMIPLKYRPDMIDIGLWSRWCAIDVCTHDVDRRSRLETSNCVVTIFDGLALTFCPGITPSFFRSSTHLR
jgi:hypothetical protein